MSFTPQVVARTNRRLNGQRGGSIVARTNRRSNEQEGGSIVAKVSSLARSKSPAKRAKPPPASPQIQYCAITADFKDERIMQVFNGYAARWSWYLYFLPDCLVDVTISLNPADEFLFACSAIHKQRGGQQNLEACLANLVNVMPGNDNTLPNQFIQHVQERSSFIQNDPELKKKDIDYLLTWYNGLSWDKKMCVVCDTLKLQGIQFRDKPLVVWGFLQVITFTNLPQLALVAWFPKYKSMMFNEFTESMYKTIKQEFLGTSCVLWYASNYFFANRDAYTAAVLDHTKQKFRIGKKLHVLRTAGGIALLAAALRGNSITNMFDIYEAVKKKYPKHVKEKQDQIINSDMSLSVSFSKIMEAASVPFTGIFEIIPPLYAKELDTFQFLNEAQRTQITSYQTNIEQMKQIDKQEDIDDIMQQANIFIMKNAFSKYHRNNMLESLLKAIFKNVSDKEQIPKFKVYIRYTFFVPPAQEESDAFAVVAANAAANAVTSIFSWSTGISTNKQYFGEFTSWRPSVQKLLNE